MSEKDMETHNILAQVYQERHKQDAKWGPQNHSPADWCMILGEEVGEVNRAALEYRFGAAWGYTKNPHDTLMEYRKELIQVAAVAVAMIHSLDRNESKK